MTNQTAARAFSDNAIEAKKLMALIFEELDSTDASKADWSDVGSAEYIRSELMNIVLFIKASESEDDAKGEARIGRLIEGKPMPFIDAA